MTANVETGTTHSPASRRARSSSLASSSSSVSTPKGKGSQKKSSSLPSETVEYLKAWMMSPDHVAHPYPTEQEKTQIMVDTGIELKQLTNWFVNNRKRFWKPRVEARLQQQSQGPVVHVPSVSTTVARVVSPGSDRSVCELPQEQTTTSPFVALDMTVSSQIEPMSQPTDCQTSVPPLMPTIIPLGVSTSYPSDIPHNVSDASFSGSDENGSEDDSTEELDGDVSDEFDHSTGEIMRTESVDVHILRPSNGGNPTIEDITILSNVPTNRVIRSYRNTMMAYTFPSSMANDRKKIRSRRDAEVVRIKKHFLRVFLMEPPLSPAHSVLPVVAMKRKRDNFESPDEAVALDHTKSARKQLPTSWREACKDAQHFRDDGLPSLEEAARLFGYTQ